jgi:hypothetical protein
LVATNTLAELVLDEESPEALYELFEARGWGDGLPVVAPTQARVDAMLAGAPGPPDEPLAVLPPRGGIATRRTVAVNAVLAGCRPEWMPVLVAAALAVVPHPLGGIGDDAVRQLAAGSVEQLVQLTTR